MEGTSWRRRLRAAFSAKALRSAGWILASTFFGSALVVATILAIWAEYPLTPQLTREWIGALSGWVAAAGALLAAGLTIPHLRQQVAEAKEQTRFALGNAEPTIEIIERGPSHDFPDEGVDIRIVNWNRRAMSFDFVGFDPFYLPDKKIELSVEQIMLGSGQGVQPDRYREKGEVVVFVPPFTLDGWRNRSDSPPTLLIQVTLFTTRDAVPRRPVQMEIPYVIADVTPRHGRLSASIIATIHRG